MTRFVLISDTHGLHRSIHDMPDGDVLIHAGDISNLGQPRELFEFNNWLGEIKHKYSKIYITPGNHDLTFESHAAFACSLITNARVLMDNMVEYNGINLYFSPYQPTFCDWAFNLERGQPLKDKWDKIPDNVDILVTHGPPYNILDKTSAGEIVGCEELAKALETRLRPKVHVFGHIHEGYGQMQRKDTLYVNASICTERYEPINEPIVVDL